MNLRYAILAPALLTTAMATYIMAAPSPGPLSEATAQPPAVATQPSSPTASGTPSTGPPPTSTPTPDVPNTLPAGLTGQLTYRTGLEFVTVGFPDAAVLSRVPVPVSKPGEVSADGQWRAQTGCDAPGPSGAATCHLELTAVDGRSRTLDVNAEPRWAPTGHALALRVIRDGASTLAVIDDPASDAPRSLVPDALCRADAPCPVLAVGGFAWASDGKSLIVAVGDELSDEAQGGVIARIGLDGSRYSVLALTSGVPPYLYASPHGDRYAYTALHPLGWQLYVLDASAGTVVFSDEMGSDGPNATPVSVPPDVKGPMYIAWSPDGSKLAFGEGFEPPYAMKIVDVMSGVVRRTEFPDGYPGEIKWSPDSTRLAVSTYNIGRTHHESYVVDPETGVARDVLSGCVIVWSPDGRFLAIHGERDPGVIIADVATLQHSQLTDVAGDAPIAWVQ